MEEHGPIDLALLGHKLVVTSVPIPAGAVPEDAMVDNEWDEKPWPLARGTNNLSKITVLLDRAMSLSARKGDLRRHKCLRWIASSTFAKVLPQNSLVLIGWPGPCDPPPGFCMLF